MSVTSVLRDMLAAGMDIATALQIAENFERKAQDDHDRLVAGLLDRLAVDEKAEKRKARDRERKRPKSGIPRNSAESAESTEPKKVPEPLKNNTPIPPLKGGTFPKTSASLPEKPKLKPISAWVAEIWELTPRPGRERSGRKPLEAALRAAERAGHDLARVKVGLAGYYASHDATKNGGEFAKGVDVAIRAGRWEAFADDDSGPPGPEGNDPWRGRLTRWRVAGYWNSEWGPKPGKPGYRGPEPDSLAA